VSFGEIEAGVKKDMTFDISNTGAGTLTGSITSDKSWLTVEPAAFSLIANGNITVTVTADNEALNQKEGAQSGKLTVLSNTVPSQNIDITIEFNATCVLVKPSPAKTGEAITFFGDGIAPGATTIRIYTLNGELIAELNTKPGENEIIWKQHNLSEGVYIYTYASPKERGVGKFTVIK